ncbi:MAG: hypothetical protein V1806_02395 [Pseudomonadota bacterium]
MPAWGLGYLPPQDPLLPSEHLPEGLVLAFHQDSPRWQPEGVLPSGMPQSFLEVTRVDGGQASPAKNLAAAKPPSLAEAQHEAEAASALLGRSDLNASVPLADPAFEFKAGPSPVPAPLPATASLLDTQGHRRTATLTSGDSELPLAFSASALSAETPARPTGGRATSVGISDGGPVLQSSAPLFGSDGRIQEEDGRGGFLALRWNPGSALGLTVGGGLQRSQAVVGGESSSWQVANAPTPSMSLRDNNSGYANTGRYSRWAAYVAVPYQLSDNLGLQPELSYYYTDMPDLGAVAGNEWVMGLQFTFGF